MKTVSELAKELNVNRTTLHRLIQRNKIETLQEGNKRLIDATAEQAILKAFQSKSLQGETLQKHCKNDAETLQRNNVATTQNDYIKSLLAQIDGLNADKAFLQSQLTAKDDIIKQLNDNIAALTADKDKERQEREQERKERQTILATLPPIKALKQIEAANAESRPQREPRRQPQKKKSWLDKLLRR